MYKEIYVYSSNVCFELTRCAIAGENEFGLEVCPVTTCIGNEFCCKECELRIRDYHIRTNITIKTIDTLVLGSIQYIIPSIVWTCFFIGLIRMCIQSRAALKTTTTTPTPPIDRVRFIPNKEKIGTITYNDDDNDDDDGATAAATNERVILDRGSKIRTASKKFKLFIIWAIISFIVQIVGNVIALILLIISSAKNKIYYMKCHTIFTALLGWYLICGLTFLNDILLTLPSIIKWQNRTNDLHTAVNMADITTSVITAMKLELNRKSYIIRKITSCIKYASKVTLLYWIGATIFLVGRGEDRW